MIWLLIRTLINATLWSALAPSPPLPQRSHLAVIAGNCDVRAQPEPHALRETTPANHKLHKLIFITIDKRITPTIASYKALTCVRSHVITSLSPLGGVTSFAFLKYLFILFSDHDPLFICIWGHFSFSEKSAPHNAEIYSLVRSFTCFTVSCIRFNIHFCIRQRFRRFIGTTFNFITLQNNKSVKKN